MGCRNSKDANRSDGLILAAEKPSTSFSDPDTYAPQPSRDSSESGRNLYRDSASIGSDAGNAPPTILRSDSGNLRLQQFRFREVSRATMGFREDKLLGEGGFGKVYKGMLRDPMSPNNHFPVAVKRLRDDSYMGQKEWLAEILVLGGMKHENLVRLIGYCCENGEGILVYEFMPHGSLEGHLFPDPTARSPKPVLSWRARVKVALDSAKGLAVLHENSIIHRDFKAPNVLLSEDFVAKLADFGLAKVVDADQTHVTTQVMGSMGYLDPRYVETGHVTRQSDVYSFGVFLLELLSGRRAMDAASPGAVPLVVWVKAQLASGRVDAVKLADPRIAHELESRAALLLARKFAVAARHCLDDNPRFRPAMADMVDTLQPMVDKFSTYYWPTVPSTLH